MTLEVKYISFGADALATTVHNAVVSETCRMRSCNVHDLARMPPDRFLKRAGFGAKSMRRLRDTVDAMTGGEYTRRWYPPMIGELGRRKIIKQFVQEASVEA
jgi:hypothetical protein